MPFKLCWQRTWPFLLMAAVSPGDTFGPCCFSPRRAHPSKDIPGQFCRDARAVGTVGGQPLWQPVVVSVHVVG